MKPWALSGSHDDAPFSLDSLTDLRMSAESFGISVLMSVHLGSLLATTLDLAVNDSEMISCP